MQRITADDLDILLRDRVLSEHTPTRPAIHAVRRGPEAWPFLDEKKTVHVDVAGEVTVLDEPTLMPERPFQRLGISKDLPLEAYGSKR